MSLSIATFCLSAASLLVVNKMCLQELSAPAFLVGSQFAFSAVVARVVICRQSHTFDMRWVPYILCFSASIYANMQLLQRCGVAYAMVVRATLPIGVSLLEYAFLDREFPSIQTFTILGTVFVSAYGYANVSAKFDVAIIAYTVLYYSALSAEMIIAKKIISNVGVWTATYYNNIGAILPMTVVFVTSKEYRVLQRATPTPYTVGVYLASCILGVGISASGWKARGELSATAYTVLGIVNKFLSVALITQVWPSENSHDGLVFICVCLLSSASYRDMPQKKTTSSVFEPLQSVEYETE